MRKLLLLSLLPPSFAFAFDRESAFSIPFDIESAVWIPAEEESDEMRAKAESGDAEAQFNVGLAYYQGEGVGADAVFIEPTKKR